jgi:Cof subfamily protein (haloacid dehalogenase superfamily)
MIKLVASDVDGTLVPDGTFEIDPEIYDVIKKLKEKGITFVAASGRQYASLKKLFAPVADRILYIPDNGGFVRGSKGETWLKRPMEKDLIRAIVEDAEKLPCGRDYAYVGSEDGRLYNWMREAYHYEIKAVPDLTDIDDDIVKISIFHPEDAERIVKAWFYDKWKDTVLLAPAGVYWVDCSEPSINKGSSLQFLLDKYEIKPDEVMVFGDNINDLGMLACAKESYAIGSARDEVKQAAAHVADTMRNQGVIKVLKEQLLK